MATSVTSARVGRRAVTIEASIWVAVIAGLERLPAARISRFCTTGTCASGSSIPRSPRATMIPPVAARDDLLGVLGRLLLLDLRDQRDVGAERAQPLAHRLEVGGAGDEGDREQVDALLDRELDPAEVAVGRRRRC